MKLTRIGDFYEAFDTDADTLAAVCGVTITTGTIDGKPRRLAGLPYHSLDSYAKRLVAAGHRVTVIEPKP